MPRLVFPIDGRAPYHQFSLADYADKPVVATKTAYVKAYLSDLTRRHDWAQDREKLECASRAAQASLWNLPGQRADLLRGPSAMAAWRAVGGEGRPTYKALRALAD